MALAVMVLSRQGYQVSSCQLASILKPTTLAVMELPVISLNEDPSILIPVLVELKVLSVTMWDPDLHKLSAVPIPTPATSLASVK